MSFNYYYYFSSLTEKMLSYNDWGHNGLENKDLISGLNLYFIIKVDPVTI